MLGESGSGKSVTLRALMRLLPAKSARIGGRIRVDGRDVTALSSTRELAEYRGRTVAMIFQEPGLAFDPVYRVGDQIAEAVMRHERVSRRQGAGAGARTVRARAHSLAGASARQFSA